MTSPMRAARAVIGGLGLVMGAWGAVLLLDTGWSNLFAAATWLVGGVVVHDFLLAPATVVVCFVGVRVLPAAARPAAAAAAVLIGSITAISVPLLGRPGAESDNPSLLPRDYVVGWAVLVGLVLLVAAGAALRAARARRTRGADDGGDGGAP